MSQSIALYRKYRSKDFDEIVGQDHIVDNLQAALKKDQISHAYLFTGPRGTGKTSMARILAREVNDLKPDDDNEYIDIVEIDAASHNSVDDIRELREGVITVPTQLERKVYIIDEVHMLSSGAFNALLKTLEEPPAHALFILATTEIHKLPATIISRTQRYNFHPPSVETITEHLRTIADNEKLKITDDALQLIADEGQGSFRDAISVLDQVAAHSHKSKIERQQVEDILGLASFDQVQDVIEAVFTQHNPNRLLKLIEQMVGGGLSVTAIASQLRQELRSQLLDQLDRAKLQTAQQLLQVEAATDKRLKLELILLDAITVDNPNQPDEESNSESQSKKSKPKKNQSELSRPKNKKTRSNSKTKNQEVTTASPANNSNSTPASNDEIETVLNDWSQIITDLKEEEPSLYAVLRQAAVSPGNLDHQLEVSFRYKLHHKKASQPRKLAMLKQLIEDKIDGNIELIMLHKPSVKKEQSESESQLDVVKNMLGGDIVRLSE